MEKISENIVTNFFNKTEDNDERAVLVFGVQRFLEDVTKIIFITIIAVFLHIFKEICIVFLTVLLYKNFIGGAHAKTNWSCVFFTSLACFFPIYFTKYCMLNNVALIIFTIVTLIFSAIVIITLAPADTKNVPIINKKQRMRLKVGASIVLPIILIVFGLIIKDMYLYQIVIICLNISNLNTTPLVYKMLGCDYSHGKID